MSEQPTDPDMSHAMLIAVLMKLGGSIELDLADLLPDAMGSADGSLYAIEAEPTNAGASIRLSVVPRP